ncbi:MAG: PhnD/SsuA/transferrin family substrate-binding protein [Deltaproteobacteria bacterium]|nr:PhnD/SsuA/transferrin family substrate-binding protein [Deltaproteobacteria bacterium]
MTGSKRIRLITLVAVFSLAAMASMATTDVAAADRVRVGLTTKDFGYLPLFVGIRAGYFADENIDLQWIQVRSNVATSALIAGELDIAASAGSAMRTATRGAPLKAIFFPYQKCTFVLMGAPNIKTVQDLKGKVIGNSAPGSTTELAANMVLEHHGLNPKKDVKFFLAGGADTALVAMQQGLIHARPFNPDAAFVLKKKGFNVLAMLADLGPWPWGGYASTDAKLSQERAKIKRWTRAMAKSLLHMANKKEDTIRIALQEFNYPRDVLEEALSVSVKAIDSSNPGGATEESLRKNIALTIVEPMNLRETPPIAKLVDFSLLNEVQAELGLRKK